MQAKEESTFSNNRKSNNSGSIICRNATEESKCGVLGDNYQKSTPTWRLYALKNKTIVKMIYKEAKQLCVKLYEMLIFDWFWPTKLTTINASNQYQDQHP